MDCVFCSIINGEIPSKKVWEDEYTVAFYDIKPLAPVHIVVIPKLHITGADAINADNSVYVAKIFEVIPKIAAEAGLADGYRIISNCGEDACQTVPHLHFHILGGKKLPDDMV